MLAFTNTTMTKPELLTELRWHQEQDNFLKGTYQKGDTEKGCAVGCAIMSLNKKKGLDLHPGDHGAYERHFGVPQWLARVEDDIFEGVSLERSKTWPVEFIEAINPGADLERVKRPFMVLILRSTLNNFDHQKYPEVLAAVNGSIDFWETEFESEESESAAWGAAWSAARSAAWSAAFEFYADELLKLIRDCK